MKLQAKQSVFMSRGHPISAPAAQPDPARIVIYKRRVARRLKRAQRLDKEFARLAVRTPSHV